MKILSSKQIKSVDKGTIVREGISSLELMKRAATAFCDWFIARFSNKQLSIVIFSGVGNNGGDGLAVARILNKHGYNVKVCVVEYNENYTDDCAHNVRRIKAEKIPCKKILEESDIPDLESFDIVIDAIFGTGLSREVSGTTRKVIEQINNFNLNDNKKVEWMSKGFYNSKKWVKSIISIDVPSGLFLDRPTTFAVNATETVTFQIPKLALYMPQNALFVGNVTIVDIGLNDEVISEIESKHFFTEKKDIKFLLKPLAKFAHKGTEGHVLIVGGSLGKIGSVHLASKAALKMGCGLVTAYVPNCGTQVMQSSFPEAMVIEDSNSDYISEIKYDIKPDAVGVGVGIGQNEETALALRNFIQSCNVPLVLDADGLNILAKHPKWLQLLPPKTILTPHPKELSRIIGEWSDDFDKIDKTKQFAEKYNLIVVVKGAYSLIIDSEYVFVNSSGTPALATAGSGDVLTGMIASLLAQGYNPLNAARVGVFIHGMTSNITTNCIHPRSFVANDIIENIGDCYIALDSITE